MKYEGRPKAIIFEPLHDKTNKMTCMPSEDTEQPGHPPSLIRAFAVRMEKPWVLGCPWSAQLRLWSDWADAQADLSLCWTHMSFCWFCRALTHLTNLQTIHQNLFVTLVPNPCLLSKLCHVKVKCIGYTCTVEQIWRVFYFVISKG